MRLTSTLLALPALAAAADNGGLFGQYRAQFQNILGSLGVAPADSAEPAAAAAASANSETVDAQPLRDTAVLTLANWKETLYAPVQPAATTPEEWWILLTGGNKTCFGHCGAIEAAYNESAAKLNKLPTGPHTAVLNCDNEPILCNSWSASAGYLYIIDLLPPPAKTDVYYKRLNLTTTTAATIDALYESSRVARVSAPVDIEGMPAAGSAKSTSFQRLDSDGYFHPFDGFLATSGLALPVAYVLWFFGVVPNWLFMLGVSFFSRTFMGRRMGPPGPRPAGAPAAAN